MQKTCLAIWVVLIAAVAGSPAGEFGHGRVRARIVERRNSSAPPAGAVYGPGGYTPAWVYDVPFNVRYNGNQPTLGPNGYYTGDYGQMHGWGFPGGRWDPSLARD